MAIFYSCYAISVFWSFDSFLIMIIANKFSKTVFSVDFQQTWKSNKRYVYLLAHPYWKAWLQSFAHIQHLHSIDFLKNFYCNQIMSGLLRSRFLGCHATLSYFITTLSRVIVSICRHSLWKPICFLYGLAHDVGTQLRNKNRLTLDLLFLVILKSSGRKTLQD